MSKSKAPSKSAVAQPEKESSAPQLSFEKWVRGMPKLTAQELKEISAPIVLSMPYYDWTETIRAAMLNGMDVEEFIGFLINSEVTNYVNGKGIPAEGGAR